jgi:hypothetical protein
MVPDACKENPLNNELIVATKVTLTSITTTRAVPETTVNEQKGSPGKNQ